MRHQCQCDDWFCKILLDGLLLFLHFASSDGVSSKGADGAKMGMVFSSFIDSDIRLASCTLQGSATVGSGLFWDCGNETGMIEGQRARVRALLPLVCGRFCLLMKRFLWETAESEKRNCGLFAVLILLLLCV